MSRSLREVFNDWERVWHERAYDLAPGCVADQCICHDEAGTRRLDRDAYLAEMRVVHAQRPDLRVVMFDHDFGFGMAWFRFMYRWTNRSGRIVTQAGMQSFRLEEDQISESWTVLQPEGTVWEGKPQKSWTSWAVG